MLPRGGEGCRQAESREITKGRIRPLALPLSSTDTLGQWHKITPSQELSDLLLADLKEHSEE